MKRLAYLLCSAFLLLFAADARAAPMYHVTDLGTLGGTQSIGKDINASGQVTGGVWITGIAEWHAFLYDGTMHDLGTLGGPHSIGWGINASGQVTGWSYAPGSASGSTDYRAFLYDGTMHYLGTLGRTYGSGFGINASGQVTGYSRPDGSDAQHAFLYDGTMHDLGTLGGLYSAGYGINDSGQVTGYASTTGGAQHAFLYDGTMHDLGTLGGGNSYGWGINASGQVTGYAYPTGSAAEHAFVYDGTMHDLGTLGGTYSRGLDINDSGQVTGYSRTAGNAAQHAFLYDSVSLMIDLNSLIDPSSGWVLNSGEGINDAGQITGSGTIGGQTHAFLLTPVVPEPSTLALAALSIFGLMAFRKRRRSIGSAVVLLALALSAADARALTIPTVPVGNAGNAGDPSDGDVFAGGIQNFGAVAKNYRIGTTEVTNAQYVAFLNEKAQSDPLALYNTGMGSDARGGITRSGVSGSYTYSPKTDMGNKPVNYVTWYDSIRFANWLHNGQGTGDTETGAYTLLGGTATPSNGLSITRNVGATWFLTSEDEWYKSAYHQPSAQGGTSTDYWRLPTASDSEPTIATANSVGDISNPGTNVANCNFGADWNSVDGNVTTVGSAGPLSESFYGTSDQGGNVWEWNEALISGEFRGFRGGSFDSLANPYVYHLWSRTRYSGGPTAEVNNIGFRVATVPEPSTFVLAALGILALVGLRKGRRSIGSAVVLLALALFAADARAVTIPTVPVGNAGNAGDVQSQGTFGAVAYDYQIGTTEVTNAQYAAFLNAVAATDTYGLYGTSMSSGTRGGITRSGASGSYAYSVKPDAGSYTYADKPVVYVSWYDSLRFANWLHNGQGSGDTETGAYTLLGGTATPSNGLSITRNSGAIWFLTSEDEWYKAAYYNGSSYYDYPTGTDTLPDNNLPSSDSGNSANFYDVYDFSERGYTTGDLTYPMTDAGAYALSASPYGTYDQGGNVSEWNEALISGSFRGKRGSSWVEYASNLQSSARFRGLPTFEDSYIGFRVATVPEPSTFVLAAVGILVVLVYARHRARRSGRFSTS